MIGLAVNSFHNSYTDIDCAMYCAQGKLQVYENGTHKWSGKNYTQDDVLQVQRNGSMVSFKQNGVIVYTASKRLTGRVVADLSLHSGLVKGGLLTAKWIGAVSSPKMTDILWKGLACVTKGPSGQLCALALSPHRQHRLSCQQ